MRAVNYFFLFCIILLGVTFACLNAEDVAINLYVTQWSLPLSLLLVCVLGIGLLLGFFVSFISCLKYRRENRRLRGRLKSIEKASLESQP